jgi:hypothetical protein
MQALQKLKFLQHRHTANLTLVGDIFKFNCVAKESYPQPAASSQMRVIIKGKVLYCLCVLALRTSVLEHTQDQVGFVSAVKPAVTSPNSAGQSAERRGAR